MGILHDFIEVGVLAGEAAGADEFDESVVVDEDVGGVDVADLGVVLLELGAGADERVEQVPQFGLHEVAPDVAAVVDLHLEDVGEVLVGQLHRPARPAHPRRLEHRPHRQQQHLPRHRVLDSAHLLPPPRELPLRLHHAAQRHQLGQHALLVRRVREGHLAQAVVVLGVRCLFGFGVSHV